jgi:hypothetical protein
MKSNLLNEINRNREIMGLEPLNESNVSVAEQSYGRIEKKVVGTTTSTEDLKINTGKSTFGPGKYKFTSLTDEAKKNINDGIQKVANFIKKHPEANITIELEVGESRVTNYDREKSGCENGFSASCKLPPGRLAELRGKTLSDFVTNQFNTLKNQGVISKMPVIPEPKSVIGTTPYTKGSSDPKDERYKKEQFIRFNINVEATKTEEVVEERCLIDFVIDVSYHKERSKEFPCRGGHRCNQAEFDVFLNETLIGTANLNNGNDGGDREAK